MIALPKPTINEALEAFLERAMEDSNMLREYSNYYTRLDVSRARWYETQMSRDFYVAVAETPVESLVADPMDSKGKTLPSRGEPLTDPETQKT